MRKSETIPPRGRNRVREREARRMIRAAKHEGAERVEIDLAHDRISVILAKPGDAPASDNDVENWLSKQKG